MISVEMKNEKNEAEKCIPVSRRVTSVLTNKISRPRSVHSPLKRNYLKNVKSKNETIVSSCKLLEVCTPPNTNRTSVSEVLNDQLTGTDKTTIPIRATITQVLREQAGIKKKVQQNEKVIKDISAGFIDPYRLTAMLDAFRIEQSEAELREIERKHLLGRISQEEAKISKMALQRKNKINVAKCRKHKQEIELQLAKYRKEEEARIRELAEKSQTAFYLAKQAQTDLVNQKKRTAKEIQNESREIQQQIIKKKKEELSYKINLIRQIKELEHVTKASFNKESTFKNIDISTTCSMSISELRVALAEMRNKIHEELEVRRKKIQEEKLRQKTLIENAKQTIEKYKSIPRKNSLPISVKTYKLTPEIMELRKKLEQKKIQANRLLQSC